MLSKGVINEMVVDELDKELLKGESKKLFWGGKYQSVDADPQSLFNSQQTVSNGRGAEVCSTNKEIFEMMYH